MTSWNDPPTTIPPYGYSVSNYAPTTSGGRLIGVPICPDLLDHSALGVADNWRGRVVRAFFLLMRTWPT